MIYGREKHSFRDLGEKVDTTVAFLRAHVSSFDSIIVTGVSGIVVGAPVALALRKPLIVVRKENDGSHHQQTAHLDKQDPLVIGAEDLGARALFLDDFVSSGRTRARVNAAAQRYGAELVAQYEYADQYQYFIQLRGGKPIPPRAVYDTGQLPTFVPF